MDNIMQAANKNAAQEEEVRNKLTAIFTNEKSSPDYQSAVLLAVDCSIRIFNVLLSVRRPTGGHTHKAIMDLVVGLGGNPFWSQHGVRLMPLLHIAVQAQADYSLLRMEKASNPNATHNDQLIEETKLVGLEIFVMVLYLLGEQELMSLKALETKQALLPYFMD